MLEHNDGIYDEVLLHKYKKNLPFHELVDDKFKDWEDKDTEFQLQKIETMQPTKPKPIEMMIGLIAEEQKLENRVMELELNKMANNLNKQLRAFEQDAYFNQLQILTGV